MENELETLGYLPLRKILLKLSPPDIIKVSCANKRLRDSAYDDSLWAQICSQELQLSTPQDEHGNPLPCFKVILIPFFRNLFLYLFFLILFLVWIVGFLLLFIMFFFEFFFYIFFIKQMFLLLNWFMSV